MSTADKIGLLPGFGWIAGHGFLQTVLICIAITPGMMIIIAPILESRLLPLSPNNQFLSFFPGDLFLGGMAAGLLVLAAKLPEERRFYNSAWFHGLVLLVTVAVAIWLTRSELHDPNGYGPRAVLSPTKLYHNLVLYGGYGYIIVTTLVAVLMSATTRGWLLVLCLFPGIVWVFLLVKENSASDQVKEQRIRHAHITNWRPFWSR